MAIDAVNQYSLLASVQKTGSVGPSAGMPPKGSADDGGLEILQASTQGKASSATISAMGATINQLNQVARRTGDAEVMAGFQTAMQQLIAGGDQMQTIGFLRTAEAMADTSTSTFAGTFATVARMTEAGAEDQIGSYLGTARTTFATLGNEGVHQLNQAVDNTLAADYQGSTASAGEALSALFAATRDLMGTVDPDSQVSRDSAMQAFSAMVKEAATKTSGDSVWSYFNEYTGSVDVG